MPLSTHIIDKVKLFFIEYKPRLQEIELEASKFMLLFIVHYSLYMVFIRYYSELTVDKVATIFYNKSIKRAITKEIKQ